MVLVVVQERNVPQSPPVAGSGRRVTDPKTFTRSLDSANLPYASNYRGHNRSMDDPNGRPRQDSGELNGVRSHHQSSP